MLWCGRKVFLVIIVVLYFHADISASKMMHENDDQKSHSKLSECDCGEHSTGCRLGDFNENVCSCRFGHAQKNDTCQVCDCGEHSAGCRFEGKDDKICYCRSGYADRNGTCQECDCGEYSTVCRFWNNTKACTCQGGYAGKDGTCKECSCGEPLATCFYDNDGNKVCWCNLGEFDLNGTCTDCGCGQESTTCKIDENGNKKCMCLIGYADKLGTCLDCDCGLNAMCNFDENGDKNCTCFEGYAERNGQCIEICGKDDDCRRNEMCKREGNVSFCVCKPNFKGKNCEINELCEKIDSLCHSKGAICEIVNSLPECKCPPGKSVRLQSGTCEGACNMDTCFNGECEEDGMGSFKCICKKGFTGKRCEERSEKHDNSHILIIIIILASISLFVSLLGTFYMMCCK